MSRTASLNNPGPVTNPAKNSHRVGASNHHQTGSGEIPMVGKELADHIARTWRTVLFDALVAKVSWLEAENDVLRVENAKLRGELDASSDAVLDLLHDLEGGAA